MQRKFFSYGVKDYQQTKEKLLKWLSAFEVSCLLDNHDYTSAYHSYNCLAAAGVAKAFTPGGNFRTSLDSFITETNDWIFGHFNYEFNHSIYNIIPGKPDYTFFPGCYLFVPEVVIELRKDMLLIGVTASDAERIFSEIVNQEIDAHISYKATFESRISKREYVETINRLKDHIDRGDCYEINYCQEFFAASTSINPMDIYRQINKISPNPFSCFYKLNDQYVLCASPERFLRKEAGKIISQPIKGTAKRDLKDEQQDRKNKENLLLSEKEKRENIIVVDLVRNDLSKICLEGTVIVEELCGVYTFPTVYQMISTIAGTLRTEIAFADILDATFPMGSMTGAPKKRVLELIEKYEKTKRGIYSGTIGYIAPNKNFDFNVVIRSLVYNAANGYISYHTGGGITSQSNAKDEYEECLAKAKVVFKVFSGL